jgi:hypothetical protein
MRRRASLLFVAVAGLSCHPRVPTEGQVPRIVIIAQRIITNDPVHPSAEALVVEGPKLAFVGTAKAALAFAGDDAAVERWPDSTVVPGLVDAHAHLAGLGRARSIAWLGSAHTEAEAAQLVAHAGPGAMQGGWLVGQGWDQNDWNVTTFPTRASLDAVAPTTPVFLTRIDGHAAWVNSEALKRAGITRQTKDPAGGHVERDAAGEPTGVLVDTALELVEKLIPPPDDEALQRQLKLALETCARLGLTQVHDAGMNLATVKQLQAWDLIGRLPIRVYAMADGQGAEWEQFLGIGRSAGRLFELKAVKLLADGALGSRGAALLAPYRDDPKTSGLLLLSPEELEARARAFNDAGFQVAIHAIGDRANEAVITLLGRLETARPGARHRVEHVQVLQAGDAERLAKAHLVASMQPTHATSDMPWAVDRLGPERLLGAYAWRSLLLAGAHLAFGSDFPIEDPNPLWGLYAARTRTDHAGLPEGGWLPEQRLSGQEALEAFTTGAAYAAFAEDRRGQLKEGFDADFVVLPVDPVEGPAKALLDAKVQVTFVRGLDVYRATP